MGDKFEKNEMVYLLPPAEGQSSIEGRVLSDPGRGPELVLMVVDRYGYGTGGPRLIEVPRDRLAKDRRRING